MSTIERSVDVGVPVHVAYNQWTQFEEFPKFMKDVEEVTQIDDTRLYWRVRIGGKTKDWEAVITEQIPDTRIAWRDAEGVRNAGVVTFHRISDSTTRVMLQMEYLPEGLIETAGNAMGVVERQIETDLKNFKEFIEERGTETGAWREEIPQEKK